MKNTLLQCFDVSVFDRTVDGILGILLTHKITRVNIVIFVDR